LWLRDARSKEVHDKFIFASEASPQAKKQLMIADC
jgi:hypothetical protein